ncbi:MAG: hypothetical protein CL940_00630 [Deltaproteobacteria bacterium]|nr:hypothetical protein [Deltaproteobacteria bacterium]
MPLEPAMNLEETVEALACMLDAPDRVRRAEALLRGVGSVQAAAQGDVRWWRARGAQSSREAERLVAAFKLHALVQARTLPSSVASPEDVVRCLRPLASRGQEELWVLTVDTCLRPIGRSLISRGGRASCSATPSDVLRVAVLEQAAGIFLAHNHPSGDPRPSAADQRFTRQVRRGARALGLIVHDHIVLCLTEWSSELTGARGRTEPRRLETAREPSASP